MTLSDLSLVEGYFRNGRSTQFAPILCIVDYVILICTFPKNKYILVNVLVYLELQSNLVRNQLFLRNHFSWQIANLLHKNNEHLALRNTFRVTKKFLIAKFDCILAHLEFSCFQRFMKLKQGLKKLKNYARLPIQIFDY